MSLSLTGENPERTRLQFAINFYGRSVSRCVCVRFCVRVCVPVIYIGQTGSGKTYTMFGKESTHHKDTESSAYIRSKFREYNRQRGVVIRACEDVFGCLAERQLAAAKQGALAVVWTERPPTTLLASFIFVVALKRFIRLHSLTHCFRGD